MMYSPFPESFYWTFVQSDKELRGLDALTGSKLISTDFTTSYCRRTSAGSVASAVRHSIIAQL